MISGINLLEVVEFSLPDDVEPKTIWKLSAIPSSISGLCAILGNWDNVLIAIRLGLKGWTNFQIDGKEAECVREPFMHNGKKLDGITEELLNKIPPKTLIALGAEIYRISKVTDEERKNS